MWIALCTFTNEIELSKSFFRCQNLTQYENFGQASKRGPRERPPADVGTQELMGLYGK